MQISQQLIDEVHSEIKSFPESCRKLPDNQRQSLIKMKDIFYLLNKLYVTPEFPLKLNELVSAAIRYINSEYDFLPADFSGSVGSLDDIMVAAFVLKQLKNKVNISDYCSTCNMPNIKCDDIIEFCSQYLPAYVTEKIYRDFTLE